MIQETQGIVISSIQFKENSSIVQVYTPNLGLHGFLVSGSGKRAKRFRAVFQPLSLVDIIYYHKEGQNLSRIKEYHLKSPFMNIQMDILKTTVALFIAELLLKCLREDEPNTALYAYLNTAVQYLELTEENIGAFPFVFLVKLTRFFGIEPHLEIQNSPYFDLLEAKFVSSPIGHDFCLNTDQINHWKHAIDQGFDYQLTGVNSQEKDDLLSTIITYFQLHVPGLKELQSKNILKQILHD